MPNSHLIIAASACFSFAAAFVIDSTLDLPILGERQVADCSDLTATFDATCWDQLNIADYMGNPSTGWKATTPACAKGDSGQSCCQSSEPWSTCFLRLATGISLDCTSLSNGESSCPLAGTNLSPGLDPSIAPKANYVIRNIGAIYDVFQGLSKGKLAQTVHVYYSLGGTDRSPLDLTTQATAGEGYTNLQGAVGPGTKDYQFPFQLAPAATVNQGNVWKAFTLGLAFWGVSSILSA